MDKKKLNTYKEPRINSLIFKLTDFCNLGCSYCYRGSNEEKPNIAMSNDLIKMVIKKYVVFKKETGRLDEPLVLVWHGGEPLTAGIDKFRDILKIEETIKKEYPVKFINSVQTNGTLITPAFATFFKENNFIVGFSLDGPKHIQDINRYNKSGDSSFDATMRGIKLIHNEGICVNAISVISKESVQYSKEIYEFMRDANIDIVDFIPSFYYDTDVTLAPEAYTKFMLDILGFWREDKFKPLKIRFLNDVYRRVVHRYDNKKMLVECELAGCCGQNFSIGIDGLVCPCECLTPVQDFYIGNIKENSFSQLIDTVAFKNMVKQFNDINDECSDCEILDLCRAGCLNRRLSLHNLNAGKDIYCEPRKAIIKYMIDLVELL